MQEPSDKELEQKVVEREKDPPSEKQVEVSDKREDGGKEK